MFEFVSILLFIFILMLLFLYRKLQGQICRLKSEKKSLLARFGKTAEQFLPFLKDYPFDPENFRFLGSPIDGVQFGDEKIIFIEFKTGDSRLSTEQKRIKELVNRRKVEFMEIRI